MVNNKIKNILLDWGVKSIFSFYEVKKKYRELAHQNHPDKSGSNANFVVISQQYNLLKAEFERLVPQSEQEILSINRPIGYFKFYNIEIPILNTKGKNGSFYITN